MFRGSGSGGSSSSSIERHLHPIGMLSARLFREVGEGEGVAFVGNTMEGWEGEGECGGVGREGNLVLLVFLGD